jgi:hypothetical protein
VRRLVALGVAAIASAFALAAVGGWWLLEAYERHLSAGGHPVNR